MHARALPLPSCSARNRTGANGAARGAAAAKVANCGLLPAVLQQGKAATPLGRGACCALRRPSAPTHPTLRCPLSPPLQVTAPAAKPPPAPAPAAAPAQPVPVPAAPVTAPVTAPAAAAPAPDLERALVRPHLRPRAQPADDRVAGSSARRSGRAGPAPQHAGLAPCGQLADQPIGTCSLLAHRRPPLRPSRRPLPPPPRRLWQRPSRHPRRWDDGARTCTQRQSAQAPAQKDRLQALRQRLQLRRRAAPAQTIKAPLAHPHFCMPPQAVVAAAPVDPAPAPAPAPAPKPAPKPVRALLRPAGAQVAGTRALLRHVPCPVLARC